MNLLRRVRRLGHFRVFEEAGRIIGSNATLAFLGGTVRSLMEMRQRHLYALSGVDQLNIDEVRTRHMDDFGRIVNDFYNPYIERKVIVNRTKLVATSAVWTAYNYGKLNTYRKHHDTIIRRQPHKAYSKKANEVIWQTAMDERVCPECSMLNGRHFPLMGSLPPMPLHPNCRCEWIMKA